MQLFIAAEQLDLRPILAGRSMNSLRSLIGGTSYKSCDSFVYHRTRILEQVPTLVVSSGSSVPDPGTNHQLATCKVYLLGLAETLYSCQILDQRLLLE